MPRIISIVSLFALITVFTLSVVHAEDSKNSLLKGIGGKQKKKAASIGLLVRDDLKELFSVVMDDYLAEDKEAFLSHFADQLTMASRTLSGKKAAATKKDLEKRIVREFKRQDFTQVAFEEAFDVDAPTMLFLMTEEQMHDSIPVWSFAITPKEILPYMKPGDYLVIANTLPSAAEKVLLPTTIYFIFRKIGKDYVIVGMD